MRDKLTFEVMQKIINGIKVGLMPLGQIASIAGVSYQVVYEWKNRGKADYDAGKRSKYCDFYKAITQAENEGELALVAKIQMAAQDNWPAAAWLLSHRFPERWGNKVEVTHKTPIKVYAVAADPSVWDEELETGDESENE